jgi:membrane-associated protease RseP (regulator of RpoE activity)
MTGTASFWIGVLAFALGLTLSVVLHEAGHFVFARRFGMKATEFFAGFGPRLVSWRRGETEYGVKWIFLGGYVKILGMTPLEPLDPADRPRAFYRQKAAHRAIVLACGSLINIVLALVLFMLVVMAFGVPGEGRPTTTVARVSPCVPAAAASAVCARGEPRSPAAAAGLREGDVIVSFAGLRVTGWAGLERAIHAASPGPADVVVRRDGRAVTLHAHLVPAPDGKGAFFGMSPRVISTPADRLGPVDAARFAGRALVTVVTDLAGVVADLPAALPRLFSRERAESPGGQVASIIGAGRISGELAASGGSWQDGARSIGLLVASLNVFVGLLNLVPLLPLDGGHLAVLCYERARAAVARRLGRPDPGPVDYARLMPVTAIGMFILIGLGLLLIAADIVNPLNVQQ